MATRVGVGVGNTGGGPGDDHLINHRTTEDITSHASSGLYSFAGNDTLEASTPFAGQTHMNGGQGNDTFLLDVTNYEHQQGHHAYGSEGQDIFNFVNVDKNEYPITGRIDDFDYSQDRILIDGTEIDLMDLPATVILPSGREVVVRVVLHENHEIAGSGLGPQQFLVIDNSIFYALEGARDLNNGHGIGMVDHEGMGHMNVPPAEERHFMTMQSVSEMQASESVQYVDPKNFVPYEFYEDREDDLNLEFGHSGVVEGTDGDDHLFGLKGNSDGIRTGSQIMRGGNGDDIIDGNTGNDTIFGGDGTDAIAGGIDNDMLHGEGGDDHLWGGDGDDHLHGGNGNDHLEGGTGHDTLVSSSGSDHLIGGAGDDLYILNNAGDRDIRITEEADGGYDRLETDGSLDMSLDAQHVERAQLKGSDDLDLLGNEKDNHLTGNAGHNIIHGGDGDDTIYGWGGDDVLIGGRGDDVMGGQQGVDRYHFNDGDGLDKINDFNLEEDMITFADDVDPEMIAIGESDDGFVIIQYGEEQGILLNGVTLADFQEMAEARAEDGPIIMLAKKEDDELPDEVEETDNVPSLEDPVGDHGRDLADYVMPEVTAATGPGGYLYEDELDVDIENAAWAVKDSQPIGGDHTDTDHPHEEEDPEEHEEEEDHHNPASGADTTCFVATAAYQDPRHPDVVWLRKFRDEWLCNFAPGRAFIAFYWKAGPILARRIEPYPKARQAFRILIGMITKSLRFLMGPTF